MEKKSILIVLLVILCLFLTCTGRNTWIETEATVDEVCIIDGMYAISITYEVTESKAYNADGELIAGEITQIINTQKTPTVIEGDVIHLRYNIEEPTFFDGIDVIYDA